MACDDNNSNGKFPDNGIFIQSDYFFRLNSSVETHNGHFIVVGGIWNYPYAGVKVYKISPSGDIAWEFALQDTFIYHTQLTVNDADGNIYISGQRSNPQYVWLAKINSEGSLLWSRTYYHYATAIDMTLENGTTPVILTRKHWNEPPAFGMMKLDPNGNILADHAFPMDDNMYIKEMISVPSGYIVAGFYSGGISNSEKTILFRFNNLLEIEETIQFDSIRVRSLCVVNDSLFALIGTAFIRSNYIYNDYLLKHYYLDLQFRKKNNYAVVIHNPDLIHSAVMTGNNEILMAGIWSYEWPMIMKLNNRGEWLWTKFLLRKGDSRNITKIQRKTDGNLFITADYENKDISGFVIISFNDDGKIML